MEGRQRSLFGFPPAGAVSVGDGEELHPRGEFAGEGDGGASDLVLVNAHRGRGPLVNPRVLGVPRSGPSAVTLLEVRQLGVLTLLSSSRGCGNQPVGS